MAEHSMCHPGLPGPQGESQCGSPGFAAFHNAKSSGSRLWSPGLDSFACAEIVDAVARQPSVVLSKDRTAK